jgi:hypothetical protein
MEEESRKLPSADHRWNIIDSKAFRRWLFLKCWECFSAPLARTCSGLGPTLSEISFQRVGPRPDNFRVK